MEKVLISGTLLKKARENVPLTQEQLGKKIGRTRVTIIGWERSERNEIEIDKAKRISEVLNVAISDLTAISAESDRDRVIEEQKKTIEELQKEKERLWRLIEELTKKL